MEDKAGYNAWVANRTGVWIKDITSLYEDKTLLGKEKEEFDAYYWKHGKLMEETKYYTPDISDIKVGYECKYSQSVESKDNGETWKNNWVNYIVTANNFASTAGALAMLQIKTSYLTKEQIEAEGWRGIHNREYIKQVGIFTYHLFNGNKEDIDDEEYLSSIKIHNSNMVKFEGKLLSINELRYIQKLLGI